MRIHYNNFEIELIDDSLYDPSSKDNTHHYDKVYNSDSLYKHTSAHGIKIYDDQNELSSIIVLCTGGATGIHPKSFVAKNDILFLCCSSNICAFSLPSLDMKWEQECDMATCFEVYEFEDDLIVHGECEISRITTDGMIKWQFSGRDIFTTIEGDKNFEITNGKIITHDFQNYKYVLNGDGELIG
jgi:hypothetical protein